MFRRSHLLGLALLVLLPEGELLLQLLGDGRDVALLHGRVDTNAGQVLDSANVQVEFAGSRRSGAAVAALLLLATSASHEVLIVVLLALDLGALESIGIDFASSSGGELARAGGLGLCDGRGIEVVEKGLGGADLVLVGRGTGLLELLLGSLLSAAAVVGVVLGAALLVADAAGLALVLDGSAARAVVLVLDLLDGGVLLLLVLVRGGALVAEGVQVLVDLVLLGLDLVELGGDLGVAVAERAGGRVVHGLLELGNLRLDLVDTVLRLLEVGEDSLLPVQLANLVERLPLVDDLQLSLVNGLAELGDAVVDFVDGLEWDLAAGDLLLGDAGLEVLIEALHLVHDLTAGRLGGLLLGADLSKLGAKFLLTLVGRRVLVVGASEIELGLDVPLHSGLAICPDAAAAAGMRCALPTYHALFSSFEVLLGLGQLGLVGLLIRLLGLDDGSSFSSSLRGARRADLGGGGSSEISHCE